MLCNLSRRFSSALLLRKSFPTYTEVRGVPNIELWTYMEFLESSGKAIYASIYFGLIDV